MKTQTMTIPTLITEMEPTSRTVEAYQELSINLRFAMLETNLKTLAITSASEGEGKSTITANLGILFAQSGQRVLLVDGNLRHPFLHRLFALENQVGWGNLLNGQVTNLQEIISPTRVINLFLLPSGVKSPNPAQLLSMKSLALFMEDVKDDFDVILFDSPALNKGTEAQFLAAKTDGTLMVVKENLTKKEGLRQAYHQLLQAHGRILGFIYNGAGK